MIYRENNFAFIDSQNLNLGVRGLGWSLDFKRFRVFLSEKHDVTTAYLFLGYLSANQRLYDTLEHCGFVLVFKPVNIFPDGTVKGNVDAELVLQAMIDYSHYDRALIVSNDGDFRCLAQYLHDRNKLKMVISPDYAKFSALLKEAAGDDVDFLNHYRSLLEKHSEK